MIASGSWEVLGKYHITRWSLSWQFRDHQPQLGAQHCHVSYQVAWVGWPTYSPELAFQSFHTLWLLFSSHLSFNRRFCPWCGKLTIYLPWNLQTYLYLCLFSFFPLLLQKRRNLLSYLKVIFSHVLWILSLPTCINRKEVEFNWHVLVTFPSYSAFHNWPLCPSPATLFP